MSTQTEFHICCTTFFPLQNGKKELEKKVPHCLEKWQTMLTNEREKDGGAFGHILAPSDFHY
jgi:hypothetical protein